ncbi:hypothetical protein, partial [Escherichia coli]|uniref:hypothetical protein n=1 Tax=Escherichia coli TaxID=562 RepID=UPI003893F967
GEQATKFLYQETIQPISGEEITDEATAYLEQRNRMLGRITSSIDLSNGSFSDQNQRGKYSKEILENLKETDPDAFIHKRRD